MKASELILILQEAIKDHGDLEVIYEYNCVVRALDFIEKEADFPGTPLFNLIT